MSTQPSEPTPTQTRTRTRTRTRTTPAEPTRRAALAFTTRNAPQMFSPDNTDPCPEMFTGKWTATER